MDGKIFDRQALEELSKEGVTLVSQSNILCIWITLVSRIKVIDFGCTHVVWLRICTHAAMKYEHIKSLGLSVQYQ